MAFEGTPKLYVQQSSSTFYQQGIAVDGIQNNVRSVDIRYNEWDINILYTQISWNSDVLSIVMKIKSQ